MTHLPPVNLPADRSHVDTEQRNDRTMMLHLLNVDGIVATIQREDETVLSAVRAAASAITTFIEAVEPRFVKRRGRLIYLGAGTSGRLGVLDAAEMRPTFQLEEGRIIGLIAGGDPSLRRSSEGLEDDPDGARAELISLRLTPDDTVLGLTAGGTTPYVIGALNWLRSLHDDVRRRPLTGLITCSLHAPVMKERAADHVIHLATGPESITGSTRMKAGSATKMVLNAISTTLMIRSGRVYENLMVDLKATNDKLRDRAARIITTLTHVPREEAFTLLTAADGEVKTAIVMQRRECSAQAAQEALAKVHGRLGDLLDE